MTEAEYMTLLDQCNFREPEQVSKLVTSTHTDVMFNKTVRERQIDKPLGAYNYFSGLFGKEVWQDGQGMDEVREFYTPSHIPFTFSHFVKQAEICDPNLANECNPDRCLIPEGGRGTLPGFAFWKWGFQTPRTCVANIRSIRDYQFWAGKTVDDRERIDEQVMNMFYVMAALKTSGQKVTMQGVRGADGLLRLAPSSDPRNPLRGGLFNYMEEKFPAPTNLDDIVPLTVGTLEGLARHWAQYPSQGIEGAVGSRGERIYEFWYPDDFYAAEAIRNPDYMEKLKILMPNKLFPGYSLQPGDREVIGNWAPRVMPWLPRFAPTSDGRIVPVDSHVGVDIEVGKEWLGSVDFDNAPFGLAQIVSGKQGTILTRPDLTMSGDRIPIMPITGTGNWRFWNDYDRECNPNKNQPYATKDYEMGMRMDDPLASLSFLFRRRVFTSGAINECDLAPLFTVTPPELNCPLTIIGCGDNKRRENDNIIDAGGPEYVSCMASACKGVAENDSNVFVIKVDRRANKPGYDSLGCECGGSVKLFIYDEEGVFSREVLGTLKSNIMAFPWARYFVELGIELNAGECIKGIACNDGTPLMGNVIDSFGYEAGSEEEGDIGFLLDDSMGNCKLTDDVKVRYYNAAGLVLRTVNGTIAEMDLDRYYYRIASADPLLVQMEDVPGAVSAGVSCAESPNASSSSSGD